MAEANKVSSVEAGARRAAHVDPVKAGARHAERLVAQFAKKAGLGEQAADGLGTLAGSFAEGLAKQFAETFREKGGVPTSDLSAAYKELGRRHDLDAFVSAPPATVTHDNGAIDSRFFKIKDAAQPGLHRAEGSIAKKGHAVGQVFDRLGLDLGGFDGEVADILDLAGNAKRNLADRDSWISIVGQMATAALGQTGTAQQRVAAALGAGVEGIKRAATTPKQAAAPSAAKLEPGPSNGLEKNAPSASNVGSQSGAFAVRAALLSGLKSQEDAVERTAGKVLGEVFRHLGVDPDKQTKKALHAQVKRLMTDKSSANGKADPVKLMGRTLDALVDKSPDNATLGELSQVVQQAAAQNPDFKTDEGLQEAFGTLVAESLAELVAVEIGHQPPNDAKLSEKVLGALGDILPEAAEGVGQTSATRGVDGPEGGAPASEPPEVDLSRWDRDRPDLPPQFQRQALDFLATNGVSPEHPQAQALTNGLAEVLQAAVNPQTGEVHPADFALQLHAWLSDNAGASPEFFSTLQSQLTQTVNAHLQMAQVYQMKKDRYERLQSQQTDSTQRDNTAPLEKELEQLEGDLKFLESGLKRGEKQIDKHISLLQQDGFRRMAEFMIDGKWAGDHYPQARAQAAAGGGGPVGGGGGGPGGPRGMFDRDGPSGMGILPGINAGFRPEDQYNEKNLTIQQQRAIKCGEVLADPSLTIEDKIFLFMMWFTAFTDQEREGKLEELVQMDREAARIQKLKDEKQSELNSLRGARESDENRLVQAQAKVDKLGQLDDVPPDELQAAKEEVGRCQQHLIERDQKIRGVEHEISDLRAKHDQAPKSREVLFMEIERLNQLRDKIMNMARSIMENSNRAIEKIFR